MANHDWDAIKDNHPIAEVIGKSVSLKQRGNEFTGICPFHAEKSPSFTVNQDKGFFHCFGCGENGDVIDFVAKIGGISTIEAMDQLTGGKISVISDEEKAERKRRMKEREKKEALARNRASNEALARWKSATEYATDLHPYLVRKGVPAYSCKMEGDNLLLPIVDNDGKHLSVQTISPDGDKRFHPGAPVKSGRMYIGVPFGRTIVCEGYATGASIYDAIPDQVCIAFSKSNMAVVARELIESGASIILAADTNAETEMRALGRELDCPVAVPAYGSDFNDQAMASGPDNVRESFDKAMREYAARSEMQADGDHTPAGSSDDERPGGLPFSIAGVCLKSPPGLVGEIAQWIESQNRRPRPNIAVAAALVTVSNIAGLRHIDAMDGITANLFAFCVAGSRTGKESVCQSMIAVHRAAGIAGATHGGIKSEQEIVRNLTRNQAAYYIVDEIGFMLQKIKNAQARGGAAYLEGVIGVLMSVYSKANGYLLLSGDVKASVEQELIKESGALQKKLDDGAKGPFIEGRLANILRTLATLDNGLEKPYLSMMGFTTPVTFDDLVDYQTATNGFIGRALLFNDRDTAPRTKKGLARLPLSDGLAQRCAALYSGGEYDTFAPARVEWRGDIVQVPTTPEAAAMMDSALDWFEDQAIAQKGQSGLESLFLGAYELIGKVSLILAIEVGERTADHVRWAFALIKRDVEEKMRLVIGNDRAKDSPAVALKARICNALSGDDGETRAVLYNRIRDRKKDDIDAIIEALIETGHIEGYETGSKYRGQPVVKYRFVGGG